MLFRLIPLYIIIILFVSSSLLWAAAAVPKQRQQAQKQQQMKIRQQQQIQAELHIREMQMNVPPPEVPPEEIQDIVDLPQLLEVLATSSEAWSLIIDQEAKQAVVDHFIQGFAKSGVTIQKPAGYYAQQIDGMTQTRPEMLQQPFPNLLQTMAVIEYDFNNGMDKDAMAMKVLGQAAFQANRQRLGIGQQ